MSLYRGAGGASDATDDSTVNAVAGYASSAASSAAAAADSASAANTSASAAATSASGASTSASSVAIDATNASNSASLASTYAAAADISKNAAAASAATASTQAGLASSNASSASSSASTATSQAAAASSSASAADTSATNAANSASSALAIYGNTAAMNAAVAAAAASASTATTQAGLASASASSADASETASFENAQNAAEWASTAQGAANSAEASASSAEVLYGGLSAVNAAVQTSTTNASQAVTSANNAAASASSAATSASTATTQAGLAAASAASASAVVLGNEPVRPLIKPTLLLDFANTEQLDPRITFTRASTGTFYGTQTAKAEQNLLLQSQDFTTTWSVVAGNATVTSNTSTAPDGTSTADTLTEDSALGFHLCFQNSTVSGVITLSIFAKLGSGTRFLTIGVNNSTSNYGSATFDLSSGTSTQTQAAGTYSSASATITAVSQGFYRCTFTVTTDTTSVIRVALNNTGTPTASNRGFGAGYTGDGTSSLILWGAQLEQRSAVTAYTPTTTQPITNYISVLQTAASGVARFDHNPITDESLGLLIEEQRTNLRTYSEDFTNAVWTKSGASITADTVIAPDGTLTGDKLVENTATSRHFVTTSLTLTANTVYTLSVYMKAGERTTATFGNSSTANWAAGLSVVVNLATGVITSGTGTIQSVGNGWYRVSGTGTFGPANANGGMIIELQTTAGYTGDGYSGIYLWGAQLEAGAFPTSYIQTVASQVTRAADAASMTGTNFSSWYNQAEGTLYADYSIPFDSSVSVFPLVASFDNGSTSTRTVIAQRTIDEKVQAAIFVNNVLQVSILSTANATYGPPLRAALSYKTDDVAFTLNANAVQTDTSSLIGTDMSALRIGNAATPGYGNALSGTIRKLSYYPLRVTNAQLQGLTTV